MKMGIGIGWPNASAGISYVSKLIKAFKARVLSYPNSIFEAEPCLDATLVGLNAIGLLKEASLVITPNAYNEGILYDVVPNTTLGDMDVVRATTATRVNSAGLIEVVPRNLLTYSNDFSNGVWIQQAGTSVVSTNNLSPSGLLDAAKVISNGSNGIYQAPIAVSSSLNNTKSIYLKGVVGGETVLLRDPWQSINTISCTLTTEWQRFSLTEIQSGGEAGLWVKNIPSTGIYIYGAQLESFATATEYFPTTTRLNIPRIDYSNGSCPSLLVEPQRTNLVTYSEQFDDISWSKFNSTINANSIISPDGTQNADTLNGITGASSGVYQIFTPTSGFYTLSVFAKKGTKNWISFVDVLGLDFRAWFNLDNGTLGTIVNGTAKIEDFGNGWYRCTYTSSTALTGLICQICIAESNNTVTLTSNGNIYMYGAQTEIGSYATSYIPTVASAVTRNADVISKTGISSLIGQTEGTMFWDGYFNADGIQVICTIHDFADNKRIEFWADNNTIYAFVGADSNINVGETTISNGRHKFAIAYKSGDLAFYVDGNLIGTSSSTFTITLTSFRLDYWGGGNLKKQQVNSAQLYKTALTNTEMAQLTTL
jgi:hypothetical protein